MLVATHDAEEVHDAQVEAEIERVQALRRAERERVAAQRQAELENQMAAAAARRAAERAVAEEWRVCAACKGKGFFMSTQSNTINYSPLNGKRLSVTTTSPRYDGMCGKCSGAGQIRVR